MKRIHIFLLGLAIAFGLSLHAVQSTINVGSSANDGTGDTLRSAMQKVNSNFTELYNQKVDNTNAVIYGSTSGSWTFGSTAGITSSSAATLGVGTSSPGKAVEINSATGANLRLTYNDSDGSAANYADFSMSSGGDVTIAPSGADLNVTGSITATGSILPGNGLNIGGTGNRAAGLFVSGGGTFNCNGLYTFQGTQSTASGSIFSFSNSSTSSSTSSTQRHVLISNGFAPTSGTAIYNHTELSPTINQTGGASGITRGLYINPTVTAAADFRSFEIATGNAVFGGPIVGGVQSLSGAGAVNITQPITEVTSTGAAQALTLADGVAGQEKTIIHGVDGGSAVLTPTTKTGFSTVTFTTAGESVTLVFLATRGWCVKSSYLATIAP